MRLHQPRSTLEALERLLARARRAGQPCGASTSCQPSRPSTCAIPGWLDARLVGALERRGISALYSHQAEALEALRAGQDVAIVTPTASGKSLCYDLPVLQAVAEDPSARALYLFPTKALSQDQLAEFRELAEPGGAWTSRRPSTTATRRRRSGPSSARPGQVVVTNPDMLRTAILPHHTKWFQLFEQLRYIVIDEAHTYRGIFGSHVANVLRGCCASAPTTARHRASCAARRPSAIPGELAETLTGRPIPRHRPQRRARRARSTWSSSTRRSSTRAPASGRDRTACRSGRRSTFLRAGRQTIVFGRARVAGGAAADLAARGAPRGPRAARRGSAATAAATCPPSGGPSRPACAAARSWASSAPTRWSWASTSVGWTWPSSPATRAPSRPRGSRWAAPAGAASPASPSSSPAPARSTATSPTHPEYLFESTPEEARLDPENLHVLLAHLRAATFELPFDPGERLRRRPGGRPAGLPRGGGPRPPGGRRALVLGERELPRLGDRPARRRAGERGHHRHGPRAAAGHRRGGPVRGPRARPREGHLPPRVAPVPRRPLDWEERKALRPTRRRRPLHPGGAGGDAQAARGVRQSLLAAAGSRAPRRGHGLHPSPRSSRSSSSTRTRTSAGARSTCRRSSCTRRPGGWRSTRLPSTAGGATSWMPRWWAPGVRSRRWPACCS